jgi:hypothetical protein
MKRRTKQAASGKSEARAKMAIPGPDIGTEYDGKGNPIPLPERLPENREKVEELIEQAAIESDKR